MHGNLRGKVATLAANVHPTALKPASAAPLAMLTLRRDEPPHKRVEAWSSRRGVAVTTRRFSRSIEFLISLNVRKAPQLMALRV